MRLFKIYIFQIKFKVSIALFWFFKLDILAIVASSGLNTYILS